MMAADGDKFCLRWNDFESNISSAFKGLRNDKEFFDVTLACENEQLEAHKVILSACSPFFRAILKRNPHPHPLLYLKGVKFTDLEAVLNFMYHGEVNVAQKELNSFLAVAEELEVKGLTQNSPEKRPAAAAAAEDEFAAGQDRPVKSARQDGGYSFLAAAVTTKGQAAGGGGRSLGGPKSLLRQQQAAAGVVKQEVGAGDLECIEDTALQAYEDTDYSTYDDTQYESISEVNHVDNTQEAGAAYHSGQYNDLVYQCDKCHQAFTNPKSLMNHLHKHSGRTYCHICDKVLSTVFSLNSHMKKLHQRGEKT